MTGLRLRISEDASDEIEGAIAWYHDKSLSAAEAFAGELERALEIVACSLAAWPLCLEGAGARRYVMRKFPFSIIYLVSEEEIQVVALAHQKRAPGYWLRR